jgi:hypothetical protein
VKNIKKAASDWRPGNSNSKCAVIPAFVTPCRLCASLGVLSALVSLAAIGSNVCTFVIIVGHSWAAKDLRNNVGCSHGITNYKPLSRRYAIDVDGSKSIIVSLYLP